MSTLKVNALQDASGKGFYPARAWVNFNGMGTVAIRADQNVSSITDNTTGDYRVNFSNNMSGANYSATAGSQHNTADNKSTAYLLGVEIGHGPSDLSTSSVDIWRRYSVNATLYDATILCVTVNGDM